MNRTWQGLIVSMLVVSASSAVAQDTQPPKEPAKDAQSAEKPADTTTDTQASQDSPESSEGDADDADAEQEPAEVEAVEEVEETVDESPSEGLGGSPIADLASNEFEPLEDIEEGSLAQIIPADVYPRVEWNGGFRLRTTAAINWDLDTDGTSAVIPALEGYVSGAAPDKEDSAIADPGKDTLWSTNMRLRLEPTIHITEGLGVHIEADLLDNVVLGSLPSRGGDTVYPDLSRTLTDSSQVSPRERAWYEDAVQINEAYGIATTLFGELRAGRMDDHWGLGMWLNDGDCADCDYGTNVDRIMVRTGIAGYYGMATVDFPDEGLTTQSPYRLGGQPYDLSQIDDTDQWTFAIMSKAITREELELQQRRLLDDDAIVLEGGLLYRYRTQAGVFDTAGLLDEPVSPESPPTLAYVGTSVHVFDFSGELKWQPDYDKLVNIRLEGLVGFGKIDNTSGLPVGGDTEPTLSDAINCFDEAVRLANADRCQATDESILQYGVAMESDIRLKGPVTFGLNAGFASGGSTPNWGTGGQNYDFFRFNPDYQVDLILFRNVIGTVTNAAYYNPHLSVEFLKGSDRHVQADFDVIFSHALNADATPGGASLLGLEIDGALRYIVMDAFEAGLEAGILFPMAGLGAREDQPKYSNIGANAFFANDIDPSIAWTMGGKLNWNF
ncbi:MAG: TIGR04551 family protein [bacterium]